MKAGAAALALAAALVFVALAHAYAVAQPPQASLVEAWERVQREDPETVAFEKLGERRYRFKTERFPFDGELRVLKASVDGAPADSDDGITTGVIEFDLIGLSDEVVKKYEHSYSVWARTNRFYLDKETGAWLSSAEYSSKLMSQAKAEAQDEGPAYEAGGQTEFRGRKASRVISLSLSWLPILVLACFWVWLLKQMGLKRQREYMTRAVRHMDNVEELLERIAAAVERDAKAKE